MLTGMPSTVMARSVPWSRLKPRRKYWLALPSPECWVTISPGTASSNSPAREAGRALNSSPLILVALAAVGCRSGGPEIAEPEVTPIVAAEGWLGSATAGFRALRSRRGGADCLIRRWCVSGGITVTGGSWPAPDSVRVVCASARGAPTRIDAVASNRRLESLRNTHAPHDNCHNRPAPAPPARNTARSRALLLPRPACGERSDRIVRCDPGEGNSPRVPLSIEPLTPTLSP